MEFTANENKQIDIQTSLGTWRRCAIRTHFVQIGENYVELVRQYVSPLYQPGDILSVSEKIISLCQQRVIYKKDMRVSRLARFLSRFASHSSAGIGVDSVYKMQFAIDHCGALKIIWAAFCAGVGKLFGRRGVFYKIAGPEVTGLDGFYDKSYAEYGDYGIRMPEDPDGVCRDIEELTGVAAMIVDANDFTRDILGKAPSITLSDQQLAELIADNPAGQSAQQTPFILIRKAEDMEQDCQASGDML